MPKLKKGSKGMRAQPSAKAGTTDNKSAKQRDALAARVAAAATKVAAAAEAKT